MDVGVQLLSHPGLPYLRVPYLRVPYLRVPYLRVPYLRVPYLRVSTRLRPERSRQCSWSCWLYCVDKVGNCPVVGRTAMLNSLTVWPYEADA